MIEAKAFTAVTAEITASSNRIASVADVNQRYAEVVCWGIEAALLTTAEAHAAYCKAPATALALLRQRFYERVTELIREGLGIDMAEDQTTRHSTWTAWLDDDAMQANHYYEFEADRIGWLSQEARKAWAKLCRHRCFIASPSDRLWNVHGNVDFALRDYDPKDQLASWKRYLSHKHTDTEEIDADEDGINLVDYNFGSLERYIQVMASLTAAPRGTLLGEAMGYDKDQVRSIPVIALLKRSLRFLNALQKSEQSLYSMGDEMTHPDEACVLLPSAEASTATAMYFEDRYSNTSESAGTELGIKIGAGQLPLRRALYCVATRAILGELDRLLAVKS